MKHKDIEESINGIAEAGRKLGVLDAIKEVQDWFFEHQQDEPEKFRSEFYIFEKSLTDKLKELGK